VRESCVDLELKGFVSALIRIFLQVYFVSSRFGQIFRAFFEYRVQKEGGENEFSKGRIKTKGERLRERTIKSFSVFRILKFDFAIGIGWLFIVLHRVGVEK